MLSIGHRAIFLHAEPCERCKEVDIIPEIVCNRLGSVRAYDPDDMCVYERSDKLIHGLMDQRLRDLVTPRVPAGAAPTSKQFEPWARTCPLDQFPYHIGLLGMATSRSLDPTAQPAIVESVVLAPYRGHQSFVRHPPVTSSPE